MDDETFRARAMEKLATVTTSRDKVQYVAFWFALHYTKAEVAHQLWLEAVSDAISRGGTGAGPPWEAFFYLMNEILMLTQDLGAPFQPLVAPSLRSLTDCIVEGMAVSALPKACDFLLNILAVWNDKRLLGGSSKQICTRVLMHLMHKLSHVFPQAGLVFGLVVSIAKYTERGSMELPDAEERLMQIQREWKALVAQDHAGTASALLREALTQLRMSQYSYKGDEEDLREPSIKSSSSSGSDDDEPGEVQPRLAKKLKTWSASLSKHQELSHLAEAAPLKPKHRVTILPAEPHPNEVTYPAPHPPELATVDNIPVLPALSRQDIPQLRPYLPYSMWKDVNGPPPSALSVDPSRRPKLKWNAFAGYKAPPPPSSPSPGSSPSQTEPTCPPPPPPSKRMRDYSVPRLPDG